MELTGFGELEGVELLQKLPIFARLTFEETNRLGGILQKVEVAAGAVIVEERALGDALYVIQEGECRVSRDRDLDGDHSNAEEVARLHDGELFGEMSLVDDMLTSARVSAVTACKLLKIPRADFEKLLASDDRFATKVYKAFCRSLTDRLRRANERLAAPNAAPTTVR